MENIKKAYIEFKGLEVEVIVMKTKMSYGNERFLVSPVAGKGEVWMENVIIK